MSHRSPNFLEIAVFVVATCIPQFDALAQSPIRVLLAKSSLSSISNSTLINSLDVANDVMESTIGNTNNQFLSAAFDGSTPKVVTVNCPRISTGLASIACAKLTLAAHRNTYSADIVFLAIDSITDDIALADPASINRDNISILNEGFAYVAAELGAFGVLANGRRPLVHEFGHILSLEHKADEPSKPVANNHAFVDGTFSPDLTVMGGLADCVLCAVNGTWHDFFSSPSLQFPGGETAGSLSEANCKKVISDSSWDVVASYRQTQSAQISCDSQSLGANTFQISWQVLNNQPVDQVFFDRKVGSNWSYFATSAQVCIAAPGCSEFRMEAQNENGMSEFCITYTSCDDGGEFEF